MLMFQRPAAFHEDRTRKRSVGYEAALAAKTSGRRQQNRSCDQCRKGKRGCDAVIQRTLQACDPGHNDAEDEDREEGIMVPLGPCSNCSKKGKDCTFEWLLSQPEFRERSITATRTSKRARKVNPSTTRRPPSLNSTSTDSPNTGTSLYHENMTTQNASNIQDLDVEAWYMSPPVDTLENQAIQDSPFVPYHTLQGDFGVGMNGLGNSADLMANDIYSPHAIVDGGTMRNDSSAISFAPRTVSFSTDSTQDDGESRNAHRQRVRNLLQSEEQSPYSMSATLGISMNNSLMTDSLMKIYHDSLENALSCWVTERTCPYGGRAQLLPNSPKMGWSAGWSNRMFKRIINLDRAAAGLRDQPLTLGEEKLSSKALNLAIMSFATQWAQASNRSREQFRSPLGIDISSLEGFPGNDPPSHNPASSHPADFDRTIQESLWSQARKTLQDAAHIQSFKVVFAYIIFSLTQKPLDFNTTANLRNEYHSKRHWDKVPTGSEIKDDYPLLKDLESIIESDGPPIFLEQGMRHIHSIRYKLSLQEFERNTARKPKINEFGMPENKVLKAEDKQTFDFLYWLGIMFDTLSAAMHKRPLVVSDEDSELAQGNTPRISDSRASTGNFASQDAWIDLSYNSETDKDHGLWDDHFIQEQESRLKSSPVRWPCSYEAAASALKDAAPIKVLLFRKIVRLQSLLSRRIKYERMESAIQEALRVYKFWNAAYGPFINDCIANHDNLPVRIQSWYLCLTGHWHLATLLLADYIESIDSAHLSLESQRLLRTSSNLVDSLRQTNSYAVSNLARCSSPREDASFPRSPDYHFALNECALLTEPWTQVLIRVFVKAGVLLLKDNNQSTVEPQGLEPFRGSLQRCEDCVRALWYLGRKSDMARLAADTLGYALQQRISHSPGSQAIFDDYTTNEMPIHEIHQNVGGSFEGMEYDFLAL